MAFDFNARLGGLSEEERRRFYESFAFELTSCVRGIWIDKRRPDADKVAGMKWMNEIQHRLTVHISRLRLTDDPWSDEDFGKQTEHWVNQDQSLAPEVEWALERSLRVATSPRAQHTGISDDDAGPRTPNHVLAAPTNEDAPRLSSREDERTPAADG